MRSAITRLNSNGIIDKTGAAISWVCAVHCLAAPFVISFLPLLGLSFVAGEGFEYVFIALSITVGLVSLLPAYFTQHRKFRTLLFFASGICLIVFADILFENSFFGKLTFVLVGAGLITNAHLTNRRLCMNCQSCNDA
jgi:hypothetical protein